MRYMYNEGDIVPFFVCCRLDDVRQRLLLDEEKFINIDHVVVKWTLL